MSASDGGTVFLKEFKDFMTFLQSLWGTFAGISVLFPLSNTLASLIPLRYIHDDPPGALEFITPGLVTAFSTLVTLFVVLWTFGQRHEFKTGGEGHGMQRRAWLSFAGGLLGLFVYVFVYFGIYVIVYERWGIWGGDPRRLIGDVLLLLSYSAFFAMVTRAFMLLGMREYFGKRS